MTFLSVTELFHEPVLCETIKTCIKFEDLGLVVRALTQIILNFVINVRKHFFFFTSTLLFTATFLVNIWQGIIILRNAVRILLKLIEY